MGYEIQVFNCMALFGNINACDLQDKEDRKARILMFSTRVAENAK